ncbi:PilZ domain-containing protein [Shewanella salipaludis]|uniref:Cyclic diguanosine monophosphate-binding protein n=1 Tax=Shewanella salipaludis TaxID=2723052 RepID=A0A972FUW9_9GAMM|nr:PilZ domain-containing protein [Shewanella salipaludis]NMH66565.1 PilZ domain-containing protein [Shewanella salipaludis]
MDERRMFSRVLFAAPAQLHQKLRSWPTHILDLSLNGALVEEPQDFDPKPDEVLWLSLCLPDSDIQVRMETLLVHRDRRQLGLKCTHIDIDSISHLRRMMELNLGDASLLNRELLRFVQRHDTEPYV